jgi:hypothetical protein
MNFFGDYDWGSPGSILDYLNAQGAEDPNFQGMPVGTTALALAGALYGGKTLYDAYNAGSAASAASAPAGTPVGTPGPAGGPAPGGGGAGGPQAGGGWGQGAGAGSTPITPSGAEMAGGGGGPGSPAGSGGNGLSNMNPLQLMQLGRMGTGMMGGEQQQIQPPGVVGPRQPRPIAPFYSIGRPQDMRGLLY